MTRGKSDAKAAGRGAGSSGGGGKGAASKKTSRKKYRGGSLDKRSGRWLARCWIGGKLTFLGTFGSEEEAARAWDRMRLWSCKADGKMKEEVKKLNFPLSEYTDDEVTALQSLTQDEMVKNLQGTEERVANQTSKYTGVMLDKRIGRWRAQCTIGGKRMSLGAFDSEEEAARACDRARLWSCKAGGKKKEEVQLNVSLSNYSDDEVAALQSCTQEEMFQKLRRTEERVTNKSSKYTGVTLVESTGRWRAECRIGGKKTFLGNFHSEEDAARAWDRFKLWRCKADGKTKEEVEEELNLSLSEYSDDEVTELQGFTQEELIQELRQKTKQWKSECGAKAVERPAPPGPVATVAVKREAADVVPAVSEAPAGQPPLKKIKVAAVGASAQPPRKLPARNIGE
jgi:hypothetical protein